jgi:cytochrome-b5 reductase
MQALSGSTGSSSLQLWAAAALATVTLFLVLRKVLALRDPKGLPPSPPEKCRSQEGHLDQKNRKPHENWDGCEPITAGSAADAGPLSKTEFRSFTLAKREQVSPNVFRLRFDLPKEFAGVPLNLPVGKHVQVVCPDEKPAFVEWDTERPFPGGKKKPYTPVTTSNDLGYFELLIKRYPEGNVSKYVTSVPEGESVSFRGPVGLWEYPSQKWGNMGFVAGGTGLTPMLQVIREVLEVQAEDSTRLSLLYANSTVQDVLCLEEITDLCRRFPEQLTVHFTVSRFAGEDERRTWLDQDLPSSCTVGEGRIDKDLIGRFVPPAKSGESFALFCGPHGFGHVVHETLEGMGYVKGEFRKL